MSAQARDEWKVIVSEYPERTDAHIRFEGFISRGNHSVDWVHGSTREEVITAARELKATMEAHDRAAASREVVDL